RAAVMPRARRAPARWSAAAKKAALRANHANVGSGGSSRKPHRWHARSAYDRHPDTRVKRGRSDGSDANAGLQRIRAVPGRWPPPASRTTRGRGLGLSRSWAPHCTPLYQMRRAIPLTVAEGQAHGRGDRGPRRPRGQTHSRKRGRLTHLTKACLRHGRSPLLRRFSEHRPDSRPGGGGERGERAERTERTERTSERSEKYYAEGVRDAGQRLKNWRELFVRSRGRVPRGHANVNVVTIRRSRWRTVLARVELPLPSRAAVIEGALGLSRHMREICVRYRRLVRRGGVLRETTGRGFQHRARNICQKLKN